MNVSTVRARQKRRQRNRRLLYVLLIVGAGILIIGGIYVLSQPSALDAFDNVPVSAANIQGLKSASATYGNAGPSLFSDVKGLNGTELTVDGKPVLIFVGEEGCPYCAETRWALTLALMRFGNFSNLAYMTSSLDGTDFPTFTYYHSTYSSPYLVFQAFELYDRSGNTLQTLPSNYSTPFSKYGGDAFPFLDYAGKYYTEGAVIPSTPSGYIDAVDYLMALFGNKTWTNVITDLGSPNVPITPVIRSGANTITAAICQITGDKPASVCSQNSITSIEAYVPSGLAVVPSSPSWGGPALGPRDRGRT